VRAVLKIRIFSIMFAAIHVPDFPLEAILRLEPELRTKMVAVVDGTPPILRVIGVNERARNAGLTPGMNKLEAEQFPEVVIRQRSRTIETSAHAALLDAANAVSPRIETTTIGTVILDIEGLERLFGAYPNIAREISRRVAKTGGIRARVAIAANPDTAIIAARGNAGITVIEEGKEAARLKDLPIGILPLDAETHQTLARWGIHTLGALARLPAKQLSERMGQAGVHLHRLARGRVTRPLVPQPATLHFEEAMDLDDAIHTLEPLSFILNHLLDRLFQRLRGRGLATAELHLELRRERLHEPHIRILKMPLPARNPRIASRLMMLDLESHPPGAPVIAVRLLAIPTKPRDIQNGLFAPLSPEPEKLELTLARIAAIVGQGNVGSPEIQDSHARERFEVRKGFGNLKSGESRPGIAVRMFRPPLEATVRTRDGVPEWIAFSGVYGDVATASGPWLSSGDWWNPKQWEREEWDVEIIGGDSLEKKNRRNQESRMSEKTPLLSRGGVAAPSEKCGEATFEGADGVVLVKQFSGSLNQPPRPRLSKEPSGHFPDGAATPPLLRRGVVLRIFRNLLTERWYAEGIYD
jgi:protein ImuB